MATDSTQPPTPAAQTTTQAPKEGAESATDYKTQYLTLSEQKLKADRAHVVERRKWDNEKKSWGEKLSEYESLKKEREAWAKEKGYAKANPDAYLRSVYGDNYADMLLGMKANGNAPTAEMVAAEIARAKEEAKLEFQKEFEARDAKAKQAQEEYQRQQARIQEQQARKWLHDEGLKFVTESASTHPYLASLGEPSEVAQYLAEEIEKAYNQNLKQDENGEMVGKVLTVKEMAEIIEKREKAKFERFQKLSQSSTEAPKPQTQTETQKQRITLTNGLTGSAPGKKFAASRDDALKKANERFAQVVASRNTQ